MRRRAGAPSRAAAFAVRDGVRAVPGGSGVRGDGQLPGGAAGVRVGEDRVSARFGRDGGLLHGFVAPQEGGGAQLPGAGVRAAGQARTADVVRPGELLQPPEGARDGAQVLPTGAAARPEMHLRAHTVRARVFRKRGFRKGDGMLPQRAATGRPALQRVVRPRHRLLQAGEVRAVGVPLSARAVDQLEIVGAVLLPRHGATRAQAQRRRAHALTARDRPR
mmetsp:Transcript_2658/g.11335  ORF Transcript_2658/g.11335 Transcript_2658/m.11335 type:complete len:220 (+) Transcript_2658:338-997(+)